MSTNVNIHISVDTSIEAGHVGGTPILRIGGDSYENGAVQIFLHDRAAIRGLIAAVNKFDHEAPFHLGYRHGCPGCEAEAQLIANKLAKEIVAESEQRALAGDR